MESIRMFKSLIMMNNKILHNKSYRRLWLNGIRNDCLFGIAYGYLHLDKLSLSAKYLKTIAQKVIKTNQV